MDRKFLLKSVTLFNFYNYLGEHKIEFDTNTDKNIYLFSMENGSGKTSLFHAIKWGFYGKRFDYKKTGERMKYTDFMNHYADKNEGFSVTIHFRYDGKNIIANRVCSKPNSSKDVLTLNIDGVVYNEPDSNRLLNQFVPANYGSFFMFDGEELEELARAQNDTKQVEGVLQLLGLNDLKLLSSRLEKISNTYNNQMKSELTKEEKNEKQINSISKLNAEIITLDEKINNCGSEISALKSLKKEMDEELYSLDNPELKNIENKKDNLKEGLFKLEEKKSRSLEKLLECKKHLYIEFLRSDIEEILQDISKREEQLTGVINVPKKYLSVIEIKKQIKDECLRTCPVCSNKIGELFFETDGDLENKLEVYGKNKLEFDYMARLSKTISDVVGDSDVMIQTYINNFHDSIDEIKSIQKNIDELSEQLVKANLDSVKDLSKNIIDINKDIQGYESDKEKYEGDKASFKRELDRLIRKGIKDSKNDSLSRKYAKLGGKTLSLSNGLSNAIDIGIGRKRTEILDLANEFFLEMTNKERIYQGLQYKDDNTYSMNIIKKDGNISPNPSAGELQVVAMSFLIALTKSSGRSTPILMDTPLSKLDKTHSSNIGQALAELDNQVLFLAQPMELSDEVMESISVSLAQKFTSRLSDDNNVEIIKETV